MLGFIFEILEKWLKITIIRKTQSSFSNPNFSLLVTNNKSKVTRRKENSPADKKK